LNAQGLQRTENLPLPFYFLLFPSRLSTIGFVSEMWNFRFQIVPEKRTTAAISPQIIAAQRAE
jgi:hypothetical protein